MEALLSDLSFSYWEFFKKLNFKICLEKNRAEKKEKLALSEHLDGCLQRERLRNSSCEFLFLYRST